MTDVNISEALSTQDIRISQLENAISRLADILTPVLGPDYPRESNEDGAEASPLVAPVVLILNNNNEQIYDAHARVMRLVDRIAIGQQDQKPDAGLLVRAEGI
jgi:hypothetical protein